MLTMISMILKELCGEGKSISPSNECTDWARDDSPRCYLTAGTFISDMISTFSTDRYMSSWAIDNLTVWRSQADPDRVIPKLKLMRAQHHGSVGGDLNKVIGPSKHPC